MAISAQDRPRYDGWGPDRPWGGFEWIVWHRALAAAYRAQYADEVWVSAWLDGLSRAAGGRGVARGSGAIFDSVPVSCRTIDSAFADYVSARPKLRDAVWSGIGGALMSPLAGAASVARGGGFSMQSAGAALGQHPKTSALFVGAALLAGVWLLKGK